MKKLVPLLIFLFAGGMAMSQQKFSRIIPPSFPGGKAALESFLKDNMQYPEAAKALGEEMEVRLQIKVDEAGKIFEVITPDADELGFVDESLRLVELMPDWEPATKNGEKIATKYTFFIDFDLDKKPVASAPRNFEKLPSFPGGNRELREFLIRELQYPADVDSTLAGAVVLQVRVEADGSISEKKVVRTLGQAFTEEAFAATEKMPAWEPGIADGEPIAMWFTIPFPFTTNEGEKEATVYKHTFKESSTTVESKGGMEKKTYTVKDSVILFERKPLREVDTTYKQSDNYIPPQFEDMEGFIQANMVYPRKAKKKKESGTVEVKLRINENGKVILTEVVSSQGPNLDNEALRIVKYMKNWQPATHNGKAIPDFITIPIDFVLPEK
ncbi:MAG: energy transducer TonB [Saprospiraceae bacterium]|nr:energy transducer TonB [Saprospiraceae bacterium]